MMKGISSQLNTYCQAIYFDYSKPKIIELESKRRKILLDSEQEMRMKSKAIWMDYGDENINFFHQFAKHKKTINFIWKIH